MDQVHICNFHPRTHILIFYIFDLKQFTLHIHITVHQDDEQINCIHGVVCCFCVCFFNMFLCIYISILFKKILFI